MQNITSFIQSNSELKELEFENLISLSIRGNFANNCTSLSVLKMPLLKKLAFTSYANLFSSMTNTLESIDLSSLEEFTRTDTTNAILTSITLKDLALPKAHKITSIIKDTNVSNIYLGDGTKDGVAGDIRIASQTNTYLTNLTVAEGFKAKLDLTGCNGLERDVLLGIINNLGQLDAGQTLNLIMGTTLLNKLQDAESQEAIEYATQVKGWSIS